MSYQPAVILTQDGLIPGRDGDRAPPDRQNDFAVDPGASTPS